MQIVIIEHNNSDYVVIDKIIKKNYKFDIVRHHTIEAFGANMGSMTIPHKSVIFVDLLDNYDPDTDTDESIKRKLVTNFEEINKVFEFFDGKIPIINITKTPLNILREAFEMMESCCYCRITTKDIIDILNNPSTSKSFEFNDKLFIVVKPDTKGKLLKRDVKNFETNIKNNLSKLINC